MGADEIGQSFGNKRVKTINCTLFVNTLRPKWKRHNAGGKLKYFCDRNP